MNILWRGGGGINNAGNLKGYILFYNWNCWFALLSWLQKKSILITVFWLKVRCFCVCGCFIKDKVCFSDIRSSFCEKHPFFDCTKTKNNFWSVLYIQKQWPLNPTIIFRDISKLKCRWEINVKTLKRYNRKKFVIVKSYSIKWTKLVDRWIADIKFKCI